MSVVERIYVPEAYIGIIALRSTFARLGVSTPFTVADPGWYGHLTLELRNLSRSHIMVHPGVSMFSVTLVGAPFEPLYRGRYQNQEPYPVMPKPIVEPPRHTGIDTAPLCPSCGGDQALCLKCRIVHCVVCSCTTSIYPSLG